MNRSTIYKVYGDNLGEGIFIHLKNAVFALEGLGYKKELDLNIAKGHNAVYSQSVETIFGEKKTRHAYITWVECEDNLGPLPKARIERLKAEVPK